MSGHSQSENLPSLPSDSELDQSSGGLSPEILRGIEEAEVAIPRAAEADAGIARAGGEAAEAAAAARPGGTAKTLGKLAFAAYGVDYLNKNINVSYNKDDGFSIDNKKDKGK